MRTALSSILTLGVLLAGCAPDRGAAGREAGGLVVGFIGASDSAALDAWRGARLGAEEAGRAADLIGRRFEFQDARADDSVSARAAARALVRSGAHVLIGGGDAATCRSLARLADSLAVLYLNTTCAPEAFDGAHARTAFHLTASDSVRREGVLWHGGLERFGAGQLNDRFERRFGLPAGEAGWAGWLAVKVAWEAVLMGATTQGDSLLRVLEGGAEFDGHKGQPLFFDAQSRQLRQPMFPPGGTAVARSARSAGREVQGAARLQEALAAGRALVFVSNEGSLDVSVVDVAAGTTIATVPVDARPRGIRSSADGRLVYVALSDDAPQQESDVDGIVRIDLAAASVTARHAAGSDPEQFAISPDGSTLYAANEDAGTATITALPAGEVQGTLVVGIEPEGVAVSADGQWVYITAETSNTVSVIDTRRREVIATFLVDVRPRAAAFARDGRRAYVSNEISGTLSIVDVARHAVIGSVELDGGRAKPVGIAVSPDGARVFVANGHAHTISVIDAAAMRELAVVPVGRRPWGIEASRDGRYVYVANGGSNDLSIVDARTLQVIGTVPVGDRPWGVAANH